MFGLFKKKVIGVDLPTNIKNTVKQITGWDDNRFENYDRLCTYDKLHFLLRAIIELNNVKFIQKNINDKFFKIRPSYIKEIRLPYNNNIFTYEYLIEQCSEVKNIENCFFILDDSADFYNPRLSASLYLCDLKYFNEYNLSDKELLLKKINEIELSEESDIEKSIKLLKLNIEIAS